jgi:2-methylisocitrate lyase-like PEP mutase family enzyme
MGGLRVADLAEAGVRRVSVGGTLTKIARQALADAATMLRDKGTLPG